MKEIIGDGNCLFRAISQDVCLIEDNCLVKAAIRLRHGRTAAMKINDLTTINVFIYHILVYVAGNSRIHWLAVPDYCLNNATVVSHHLYITRRSTKSGCSPYCLNLNGTAAENPRALLC